MERQFHLAALVLNKALPDQLRDPDGWRAAELLLADAEPVAQKLVDRGVDGITDVESTARVLRTIGETFRSYAIVATREHELRDELARIPETVAVVPALEDDVHDIGGLAAMGEYLLGA
jgi:hypothetical protein